MPLPLPHLNYSPCSSFSVLSLDFTRPPFPAQHTFALMTASLCWSAVRFYSGRAGHSTPIPTEALFYSYAPTSTATRFLSIARPALLLLRPAYCLRSTLLGQNEIYQSQLYWVCPPRGDTRPWPRGKTL